MKRWAGWKFASLCRSWIHDTAGAAYAEFVLIFPLLATMLFGVYDVGNALMVNQKAISAAQMVADLIARNNIIDDDMLDEIIRAGELAIMPYETGRMGVDIASVVFDDDDEPEVIWRETRNMPANDRAVDGAFGLGTEGRGVLVVTVSYNYRPTFGWVIADNINMAEVAYAHGRSAEIICRRDGNDEICE